jgi:hypothetical protein
VKKALLFFKKIFQDAKCHFYDLEKIKTYHVVRFLPILFLSACYRLINFVFNNNFSSQNMNDIGDIGKVKTYFIR